MEAFFLTQYGDASVAFERRTIRKPEPGPGHLLIKTEAFGLNFAEVMARKGMYPDSPPLPFVPGYDLVGRVEAIGDDVPEEWLGKRVAAMVRFGSYAQYAVSSLVGTTEIPENMPAGQAAALCVQYATAWHCTEQSLRLRKGDKVLIHAAAGGVGTALVQLCKWRGAEVYATAGSTEKCEAALANGADHAINYRQGDYAQKIMDLLGKDRLAASFNAVAGDTFKKDMKLLGAGGRLILFGAASRTNRKRGKWGTVRLLWDMGLVIPLTFVGSSKGVIGVNMLRIAERRPNLMTEALAELVALYEQGIIHPEMGGEYSADQLSQAHTHLESRASRGKLIVRW